MVHPNAEGHRLIGSAALEYLRGLRAEPPPPSLRRWERDELCLDARDLLRRTEGGQLVDLGRGKAVTKEVVWAGHAGAVTRIEGVGGGEAHLTYVLRRRGDGAQLRIGCDCRCSSLPGSWSSRLFPFPAVPIDLSLAADGRVRLINTTSGIFDTTAFRVHAKGCNVSVKFPHEGAIVHFANGGAK